MPDGRSFVFVRTVKKQKPQLYRYTLGGGTIVQLTHIKQGVSGPLVSNAGDRIALTVTDTDPALPRRSTSRKPASHQKPARRKATSRSSISCSSKPTVKAIPTAIISTSGRSMPTVASQAVDVGQLFGEHRCVVARRPHDSLRLVALRGGRQRAERCLHDPVYRWHDEKVASPLPANNGLFFNPDGSRVYTASATSRTGRRRFPRSFRRTSMVPIAA